MIRPAAMLAAMFGLALAGCATAGGGAWTDAGFEQKAFGWNASYRSGQKSLLGPDWQLDNWVRGLEGTLEQKTGPGYLVQVWDDVDGDGQQDDLEVDWLPLHDLKFVSKRNNGVIWTETRILDAASATKDLDILVDAYAERLASGAQGSLGRGRLAGFVVGRKVTQLGAASAVSEMIELAPRELLLAEPTARTSKVCLILTRFTFREKARPSTSGGGMSPGEAPVPSRRPSPGLLRTAFLVVGYHNDLEHFHDGLQELSDFLGRITIAPAVPGAKPPGDKAPAKVQPAAPPVLPPETPPKTPETPLPTHEV